MATKEELLAALRAHLKASREMEQFLAQNLPLREDSDRIKLYKELTDQDDTARETYESLRNEYWTQEPPG